HDPRNDMASLFVASVRQERAEVLYALGRAAEALRTFEEAAKYWDTMYGAAEAHLSSEAAMALAQTRAASVAQSLVPHASRDAGGSMRDRTCWVSMRPRPPAVH